MSKRSKACDILPKVRKEVMDRDKCCVNCGGTYMLSIAHVFYNRAHGGLGKPKNLCVLCMKCHGIMDNGKHNRAQLVKANVIGYMNRIYDNIDMEKLKYRKW